MKFDYCIGNPPYQGLNHMQLYPDFYLSAQTIADNVEMIFPTGWQEPKTANNLGKLNTEAVKADKQIIKIDNRQNVFQGITGAEWTNIILWKKGYDNQLNGKQLIYTNGENPEEKQLIWDKSDVQLPPILVDVLAKVKSNTFISLSNITYTAFGYKYTQALHDEHPKACKNISKGHEFDLQTNTFETLDSVYTVDKVTDTDICIYGLYRNKREYRYIKGSYVKTTTNFSKYKLFVPKSAGAGKFGETLSPFTLGEPNVGSTSTFMSIGSFDNKDEALYCWKYIKTKFARALLDTLKFTRDNPPAVWANIPIQDFTSKSDIDWSQSIADIDKQLYKKYGLSKAEIEFIETNVKAMS